MHKNIKETEKFATELISLVPTVKKTEVVICPPFTVLNVLGALFDNSGIKLGAQNLFWEEKGAYTGEISPVMLTDLDCKYVIIGHSERRAIMGENNTIINRKIKAAINAGLIPVFCVGENLQQRENGKAQDTVRQQLEEGLREVKLNDGELLIAYEPIWAIGTGVHASTEDAQTMIEFIRKNMDILYNNKIADSIRILYGGSVKALNIKEFMEEEDIDGALVGGASLEAEEFAKIINYNKKN